jgi:hypothetical protein
MLKDKLSIENSVNVGVSKNTHIYKGNEITRGYYYESKQNLNNGLL